MSLDSGAPNDGDSSAFPIRFRITDEWGGTLEGVYNILPAIQSAGARLLALCPPMEPQHFEEFTRRWNEYISDRNIANSSGEFFIEQFQSNLADALSKTVTDTVSQMARRAAIHLPEIVSFKIEDVDNAANVLHKERRKIRRKSRGPGRPPNWSKTKLEQTVRKASRAVIRQGNRLTLARVAEEINKREAGGDPVSENALKHLLDHYQVKWKDIKSALIHR